MGSNFKIIAKEGRARAGVLRSAHGEVQTPVFMPIGTQGSVKALSPDDLKEVGAQIILGNTYHLYLRPGSKLIKKMGGLHKFMSWDGPILTDSGGFQAFSLGAAMEHKVKKIQATSDKRQEKEQRKGESANNSQDYRVSDNSNNSYNVENYENSPITCEKKGSEEKDKRLKIKNQKIRHEEIIFSKITEDGIHFTSHLDGTRHLLTPEKSIEVQLDLGSDIVLVLDELPSPLHDPKYVEKSLERTHRWEMRSKDFFVKNIKKGTNPNALLFGIVQGVYDQKIRENEAKWIADKGFDGISIGGSCGVSKFWLGKPSLRSAKNEKQSLKMNGRSLEIATLNARDNVTFWATKAIYETMGWITPLLPSDLPRHALGIGEIVDLFECTERGVDMYDCVSPTRRARNGSLYISPRNGGKMAGKFVISIQRSEYSDDKKPIDRGCECYTCQNFSRAYLRHLYVASELLYHHLATIHNVYFVLNLMKQIREAIINKQFKRLKSEWLE